MVVVLLVIPAAFSASLKGSDRLQLGTDHAFDLDRYALLISRATAILLLCAFVL